MREPYEYPPRMTRGASLDRELLRRVGGRTGDWFGVNWVSDVGKGCMRPMYCMKHAAKEL